MLTGTRPIKFTGTPEARPSAAAGIDPAANTGSAWAGGGFSQIVSAANVTQDMVLTRLSFITTGSVATESELQIAFGAAASEVVKISIPCPGGTTSGVRFRINLPRPLFVPSGTRISCQIIAVSTSGTQQRPSNVKIILIPAANLLPD